MQGGGGGGGEVLLPQRRLLARWGGTAGVVNQAAAVQGPATSQHQGLTAPLASRQDPGRSRPSTQTLQNKCIFTNK